MDHINCNESLLEKYVLSLIKHIDTTCSLIDKASIDFKQVNIFNRIINKFYFAVRVIEWLSGLLGHFTASMIEVQCRQE